MALRRPYTFIVLAILIPLLGAVTLFGMPGRPGMPTDIFPEIRIPVISVTFSYSGMAADEMAGRFTSQFERFLTTIVNDVEHVESQTYSGINVIKVFFQPGVDINLAMAQVTAFGQTQLRQLPPGTQPPLVMKFNASTVPIVQLALSSTSMSESQIFDYAIQFVRAQIATVAGAAIPFPYGGAARQVQVDLQPDALRAQGLSAADVNAAIGNQNLILPAGTQKIGDVEYSVKLNASPLSVAELNDLPIKSRDGVVTYVRDVAHVHDGHPPQVNIVRVDGKRAVLMTIQKTGSASTIDIVDTIKERLPLVREQLPEGMSIEVAGDQSVFVKAAVRGVMYAGIIAAALTALMILLFLGSWRSTLIITISIPLSILSSIILLNVLGETINLMTLGGLALAVGILVDDATVTIENINRHLEEGTRRRIGHPRGLASDPGARARLDTGDLHRVRADVPAVGGCALPVRPDGRGRRLRDARRRTCCRARSCRRSPSTGCARRSRSGRGRDPTAGGSGSRHASSADSPHFASATSGRSTPPCVTAARSSRAFAGAVAASMLLIPCSAAISSRTSTRARSSCTSAHPRAPASRRRRRWSTRSRRHCAR